MWHVLTDEQAREVVAHGFPAERVCRDKDRILMKCDASVAIGSDGPLLSCVACELYPLPDEDEEAA